ncbi:DUF7513 family protein [Halobellus clavatus]|jgi:hypothetical protein|uniref:DUF7513 domain-containing protein n=1 Tax=Halobellus clavatus TaxID=660517 RepID=A0A1H3HVF6_9EURY|nr:hypothetical protein [Halobellus clavatus]SDY19486.1 hypothetical protein SAMN04487946_10884 [Halobellus clavatus]
MSRFESLFAGLTFRTSTPAFEVGDEVPAFVTGRGDDGLLVRVGDTVLELPDADPSLLDAKVQIEIESFDARTHRGTARVVDVLEEAE